MTASAPWPIQTAGSKRADIEKGACNFMASIARDYQADQPIRPEGQRERIVRARVGGSREDGEVA